MARGETFDLGHERLSQNNYWYVKTETGWVLKHHIVAAQKLGRPVDCKTETIKFKDRNRNNFEPDNIIIEPKKGITKEKKIELLRAKKAEVEAELEQLLEEVS